LNSLIEHYSKKKTKQFEGRFSSLPFFIREMI
jgi:hypothetical protein